MGLHDAIKKPEPAPSNPDSNPSYRESLARLYEELRRYDQLYTRDQQDRERLHNQNNEVYRQAAFERERLTWEMNNAHRQIQYRPPTEDFYVRSIPRNSFFDIPRHPYRPFSDAPLVFTDDDLED